MFIAISNIYRTKRALGSIQLLLYEENEAISITRYDDIKLYYIREEIFVDRTRLRRMRTRVDE
jgi:hypothetical protein